MTKIVLPGFGEVRADNLVPAMHQMAMGRLLTGGEVTLRAGQTTTSVDARFVSPEEVVVLSPRTANAAAALASTYVSSTVKGGFVLTHANAASTDRTFRWVSFGGWQ
jgi:hypothetical protein